MLIRPARPRQFVLLSFFAALLAGALFLPGLPGQLIFDDIPNITTNPAVQLKSLSAEALLKVLWGYQVSGSTRSLPMLSFALDYWRGGGPDPLTFKTTNILLHVLTACVLAGCLRTLLLVAGTSPQRAGWAALALATAWAAHPLQVSTVLYVVQRLQSMGTLFLVLALWAYLHGRSAQIAGRPGRHGLLLTVFFWLLALGCKEDSALLPLYTLALELTVLRFAADDARLSRNLRRFYVAGTVLALLAYAVLAPQFWNDRAYVGRDFNPAERLLTQPRALAMYLGQILLPLPGQMPFYYDWLPPSRSLLQPWTTLPALVLLMGLLALAWWQRRRRPLLALGIFLFFGAHAIASNVIALELAFEHRNHFALVGALLALGSLLAEIASRLHAAPRLQAPACGLLLAILAGLTLVRADIWSSTTGIARLATEHAPGSGRAWTQLCASIFGDGGGARSDNPRLDEAIAVCERGTDVVPESLNSTALLVVLKSIRGNATDEDWRLLQARIADAPMTRDNARIFMTFLFHVRNGVVLDEPQFIATMQALAGRGQVGSFNLSAIGYFLMEDLSNPDQALPFFLQAIDGTPPDDPFPLLLARELRGKGRTDLATRVEQYAQARQAPSVGSGERLRN